MSTATLRAGGAAVEVSHAEKVFFPGVGVTKGGLAEYYQRVAPTMLRHVRDRPLAQERYPDGIDGERIFQKNVPEHFPDWIRRVEVPNKEGGTTIHAVAADKGTLVYLADQACVTPHTWLARADKLDVPDRLIFDLDPAGGGLELLRFAARRVGDLLADVGLVPFLMTTGSRGFHVVAPLRRDVDFDAVREFAREAATFLAEREPKWLTVEQRKEKRGGRIFLDYLRNAYAQTAVPPYAIRALPAAPVATPLSWVELDRAGPQDYTIANVLDRVADSGDSWSNFANRARSLARPRRRLARQGRT